MSTLHKKLLIFLIVGLFLYGCGYKTDPIYVSNKPAKVTKTPKNLYEVHK